MTETIETIQNEKKQLNRELEQVDTQLRNMKQLEAEYDDFFHRLMPYSFELQEYYGHSNLNWYFEDHTNDLRSQQRNIFDSLDEGNATLHSRRYTLENEFEELEYTHKKLLLEVEDAHG